MECGAVVRLSQPNCWIIVTIALSSITILLNSVAIASIVKNYRRLRQRIYVFVISLATGNLLVGSGYLVDGTTKFFSVVSSKEYNENNATRMNILQLYIESLKNATLLLSSLNTALVTYVLYKRTTSMGRHHTDLRGMGMASDGTSYLPAFDTMMRVLSLGTSSVGVPSTVLGGINNRQKNGTEKNNNTCQKNSRQSQPYENKIMEEEEKMLQGEKHSQTKPEVKQETKPKRNSGIDRILSTGRRLSQAIRTRSWARSSSQPYVGRHSKTVMTKSASTWTIFSVWISFVITWFVPVLLQIASKYSTCLKNCYVINLQDGNYYKINAEVEINDTAIEEKKTIIYYDPINSDMSPEPIKHEASSEMMFPRKRDDKLEPFSCVLNLTTAIAQKVSPFCQSCTATYFPLKKLTIVFVAVVMGIVFLGLLTSSFRLYWLRKHSTNVFVRCSAIWRFVLMIAIYYIITLAPYMASVYIDFFSKADFVTVQEIRTLSVFDGQFHFINKTTGLFKTHYSISMLNTIATSFVLVHCAFLPFFYLVRLLGFRRILSSF